MHLADASKLAAMLVPSSIGPILREAGRRAERDELSVSAIVQRHSVIEWAKAQLRDHLREYDAAVSASRKAE